LDKTSKEDLKLDIDLIKEKMKKSELEFGNFHTERQPLALLYKNQFRSWLIAQSQTMVGFLAVPFLNFKIQKIKQPLKLVSTDLSVRLSQK